MTTEEVPATIVRDTRLDYVGSLLQNLLRISEEKWLKLLQSEESRQHITTRFLDNPEAEVAFISESGSGGALVVSHAAGSLPPSRQQQKVVYFLKSHGIVVSPENIKEVIVCGDLSAVTVEHLQAFLDCAVVPTLCNPSCHEGWSRELSSDLLGGVRSFRGLVARAVAQSRGHVIIAVPPLQPFHTTIFAQSETSLSEAKASWIRETVSVLECSVYQWSEQVREVIERKLEGDIQQYPEPANHYKFWCRRGKALRFIRDQLTSEALHVVAEILHSSKSPSDTQLQNLIQKVEDGVTEAEDIEMHLISLHLRCKDLEAKDLPRLRHYLVDGLSRMVKEAVEHCVSLQKPHNATVVSQIYSSIANILVHLSQQFLHGATLFRGELDDSEQRLDLVLIVMDHVRRSRIDNDSCSILDRKDRLETFVKRLQSIKVVFETASAFLRLIKTDIGGIHGHVTACQIRQIYDEFQEQLLVFDKCPYDILEPDCEEFQKDIEYFHRRISDLDERLGSIIKGCVLSCSTVEAMSKVLQMCEFLLKRPAIRSVALSTCEKHILETARCEMGSFLMRFLEEAKRDKASQLPVHLSLPQTSRVIQWVTDIKELLSFTKQSIDNVSHLFISKKVIEGLREKHKKLSKTFTKLADECFEKWASNIPMLLKDKLHQPLIRRLDKGRIEENFSPELESLIHEVKHLLRLKDEIDLPAPAVSFYRDRDRLGEQRVLLRFVIERYNALREDILSIECPLLRPSFKEMDTLLAPGEGAVLWSGEDVSEYLKRIECDSKTIHSKVQTSKSNLRKIQSVCSRWACSEPMLDKAHLPLDLSSLASAESLVGEKLHSKVKEDALKIHSLIEENKTLFGIDDTSAAWKNYVTFVDDMVKNGVLSLIQQNLQFLLQSSESRDKPIFMVHVYVGDKGLLFKPPLFQPAKGSVQGLVEELVDGIFEVASLFPRIDRNHSQKDYLAEFKEYLELQNVRDELRSRVEASIREAEEVLLDLQSFAYLWKEEPEGIVRALTPSSDDSLGNVPQIIEQIRHTSLLRNQVSESVRLFRLVKGWLRVDQLRFLNYLLSRVDWWRTRFQEMVAEGVNRCIRELDEFCTSTETELKDVPSCDQMDSFTLLRIITRIQGVQDRRLSTDAVFGALASAVKFLTIECNKGLEDVAQELLQNLPDRWSHTKKLSEIWRHQISTPMAIEASSVRKQVAAFSVKQIQFREQFRKSCAFQRDCPQPFENMLNKLHNDIGDLHKEVLELSKSGKLFEVHVPEFTQLKQCENELELLRELWQYIAKTKVQLHQWEITPWTKVDLDALEMQCKAYMRDIKSMDKEMRSWDNFLWLQETIKNILVALRAIHQLRNPAIKDRHWTQLSSATQVPLSVDESTPMGELLSLELHRFEDVVEGIVERASKELATERTLTELEATWATILFEKAAHPRTGHVLLHISDALISTLEDNQVQLQNLMSSRHVAHFSDRISEWARRLSRVESVVGAWVEVQRAWAQMESIFLGSEDIKDQLPDDCNRFMSIDVSFKKLVSVLSAESETVVSVSDRDEVHNDLAHLQTELALCEKALASYLETKRRIFPRFYFVSSADLLDILSNGTRPKIIVRHLPKLFDSVGQLQFENEEAAIATAVVSRDGEHLPLKDPSSCLGAVESWLGRLLNAIGLTLKDALATALSTYEDGNRENWIFENAAQVALTGTQIWWAAEVSAALQRVRQGHEIALKQYHKKQMQQLHHLIGLLLTELTPECRQKVMTVCTMDVHARDVVARLVAQKVENETDFAWQSQLRHRWEDEDCHVHICDARFNYAHEYLGNTARLVVTPLTDRCFITLTQSLKLMIGGAPTGPAGTGKTETVKDLGRALGTLVYVFNCSEQMDYRSCANIYKGLAQTGAWGCFDEFNRISVEVLSVVAVQVKCVQDALRANKPSLCLLGDDVPLKSTLGIFITMNPGYAGRTELPENLKTLFRPCAMVAPDSQLICEILLVAEGFVEARSLGQKFTTLYSLCRQLLSPQYHYDWGLRAIKSVLVVAGSLKRASPASPEEHILMLALRDFNLPKIVSEDVGIFIGLIGDLFPALDVPRKKNPILEKSVRDAIADLKLQPEDNFVLKVLQLSDLLSVRHSVFLVGAAGSGKSSVCRTLLEVHKNEKPLSFHLNPKVVTNDELFGTINPATREWKDGLLSSLIRDLVNATTEGPRWLILDGDIDPMWIESMNSVMDDNRILTLASRERISLTPTMRLLFEVSNLEQATPATVSRGGVLYLDPADVGWNPYAVSWIERRIVQSEKANLIIFFDKYVPPCLEALNKRFKSTLRVPDICYVQTLCRLLECLLTPENTPPDSPNELYELYFVFCSVWAFGSALEVNGQSESRLEFSNWFLSEFKSVKFPISGAQTGGETTTVFDYYIENRRFYNWTRKIQKFQPSSDVSLQSTLVPTKETHRIQYLLDLLIKQGHPVMLVGPAGCGKTSIARSALNALDQDSEFLVVNVPFSFYTTSAAVQRAMEMHLEKKVGKNFGPPGQKKIIFFIDDFNIPEVDIYGTCQPHTIIRQHLDYGHWYDRNKLTLKEVTNCQYVACLCPTAGSCTINSRLQRHFCVLSVPPSSVDSMQNIFGVQLKEHLRRIHPEDEGEFRTPIQTQIVRLAVALQDRVACAFRPTAIKFHYLFNLRDIANVFRGLMLSSTESLTKGEDLMQLWLHESQRVYRDKLLDQEDVEKFDKIISDVLKRNMEVDDPTAQSMVVKTPIHCHFAQGIGTSCYQPVEDLSQLSRLIHDALDAYNDIYPPMDLVLFEDAVRHVCRITRILESGGHALLIGVGGSGRQSLASLAAYICNLHLHQPTLHQDYDLQDFRNDIAGLYLRAGVKNIGSLFLVSDAQVVDERFLVLVNDLLSSGDIPDLFPEAEIENIVSALRSEVKSAGIFDSRDNCWNYFINKVKRRLRVVLCFSPAGSTLRSRSRKFPTLISCTCIDWFHPWPKDALVTVCNKFLEDLTILKPELRSSVADFVAFAYHSVNEVSKTFLKKERRHNETTPKSFLQHVKTYKVLMERRHNFLGANISRLEAGLQKLVDTSEQVDVLKGQLAEQEVELQRRSVDIDALLADVERERERVGHERTVAAAEEDKVSQIHFEVSKRQQDCEQDLAGAEPALVAAQEALNTLNKSNLTELRSFGSPPVAVRNVTAAVMVLLATDGKIPKDLSWRAAKLTMSKVDNFLDSLIHFDKNHIHENSIRAVQTYLRSPEFKPEVVLAKSQAAAGLCSWVINVLKYYEVYCNVEPKRRALAEANAEYQVAKEKLARIQEKVTEVESRLSDLQSRCDAATEAKARCESEAQRTAFSLHLANRLLGGLASERQRWSNLAARFRELESSLAGDVLLASAFVAYLGPFTGPYRRQLQFERWKPFLDKKSNLEVGAGSDDSLALGPMVSLLLEDETIVGRWRNDGLPGDGASVENATIFNTCFFVWRWPLIVDPQVQAVAWIRATYGDRILVVRTDQKGYLDQIEEAVVAGQVIIVENLEENIDPRLYPIIFHNFVKKGKAIKIGTKELPFHPDFRLILHTKLSNPRYGPEIQAQTTVINFGVTPEGLAEQLLAEVVSKERPDLEAAKALLTKQQSEFAVTLKQLEESLLSRLSEAEGDLVGDVVLVESLEQTKATAAEVQARDEEARATEAQIDEARGVYRDVADRTALVYFVVQDMVTLSPMYLFSLKAIKEVFHKAIDRCEPLVDVELRVNRLVESVTLAIFNYVSRGLFENHKTVLAAHLTFQILRLRENIPIDVTEFLLHQNLEESNLESPVEFMSAQAWAAIRVLSSLDEFQGLDRDMEASPKRWKKFLDSPFPEKEGLPQEWKNKSTPFHKLCILRCLRPDRVMYAIRDFVSEILGSEFVGCRATDLDCVLEEWGHSQTPILFILSAGVDPLHDLEACTVAPSTIQNVSLGQGQETIAEQTMKDAMNAGQWVVLQNIHLAKAWLHRLERKLEDLQTTSVHPDFRLFLSANPPEEGSKPIPPGVLEACLKVTNEPPKGMRANLHKALDKFSQETFDSSSRDTEFKSLLFTLCYFHAVLTERKKFGSQGWNYPYPFNDSDLLISANVLHNHLDSDGGRGSTIPWDDLRFLFGEIMYGGHITDDRDRKICKAYLNKFFNSEQLEADHPLCPGFGMPPILDYDGYHRYVDAHLPNESPILYGLHPNAEVGCLTDASNSLLRALHLLEPSTATDPAQEIPLTSNPSEGAVVAASNEDKIRQVAEDIIDKLPAQFPLVDLQGRVTDEGSVSPFAAVGLQECERMNILIHEISRSLRDIDRGLKGELPWSEEMESLGDSLASDAVPRLWACRAYPSLLPLGSWFTDLLQRFKALDRWVHAELSVLPPVVWLGGLFSPQSFLTAVIQTSGRKHDQPLDKLALHCEVTKKNPEDCTIPPREGANIAGLYMEGGRWDFSTGCIMDPLMKDLHPPMPVVCLRAVLADKVDVRSAYPCPVYRTRQRGDTFVWEFPLKSSVPPDKWVIAGTALLLQI